MPTTPERVQTWPVSAPRRVHQASQRRQRWERMRPDRPPRFNKGLKHRQHRSAASIPHALWIGWTNPVMKPNDHDPLGFLYVTTKLAQLPRVSLNRRQEPTLNPNGTRTGIEISGPICDYRTYFVSTCATGPDLDRTPSSRASHRTARENRSLG